MWISNFILLNFYSTQIKFCSIIKQNQLPQRSNNIATETFTETKATCDPVQPHFVLQKLNEVAKQ